MTQQAWNLLAFASYVHWFAKHPILGSVSGGASGSAENLHVVMTNLRDWNLYAHANGIRPTFRGIKAKAQDIEIWRMVVVDIDPTGPESAPLAAGYQLQRELGGILLDSGRGTQLWLPIPPGTVPPPGVEQATSRWLQTLRPYVTAHGCKIDTSCSDLSRVVRLPGSMNHRTGRTCRVLGIQPVWASLNLAIMATPHAPAESEPKAKEILNLSQAIPHLTDRAARFLTEGVSEPGRHSAAYAAACSLLEAGCTTDAVENFVAGGGLMCYPPLPIQESIRAVQNAVSRAARTKGLE